MKTWVLFDAHKFPQSLVEHHFENGIVLLGDGIIPLKENIPEECYDGLWKRGKVKEAR